MSNKFNYAAAYGITVQTAATWALAAPANPPQTGSASFGIELLDLPWRQRFEGTGGPPKIIGAAIPNPTLQSQITQLGKP